MGSREMASSCAYQGLSSSVSGQSWEEKTRIKIPSAAEPFEVTTTARPLPPPCSTQKLF